jgi:hypothetical protein
MGAGEGIAAPIFQFPGQPGNLPDTIDHSSGLVLGTGKTLGTETCGNGLAELGHVVFHSS